ncbi:TetR family transcriptional regulator [Amycolatopsis mediterranei S699] [Mycolicibacterium parafortuitum]|uniref:TetR family transcriptional regulator [Amycolatopsis mediterranei S699] n=2 Tax=Mycolicibacterium parafortuitum TaxID=39692 RepID=A0A375YQU0_MYCPF|nr:TetR/AcrR family transcriptional regulator [Mycolicibacterium parafortuitum]ORB28194.1 TetR family transcriptional regulator [Mycolicibacterium parafortuitum]SRX83557.1 TetR family transcriptional regulator [Amycolatopsis mediterranei S699] [Mycolicibacterium parafortuitum]
MDAALRCLADPHIGPVPMALILRTAGVSSRAFYRHFQSKDDLFLALLDQECAEVVHRVDAVADAATGDAADQLAAWIGAMFDIVANTKARTQLMVVDSDEVRAAKGYRTVRERLHTAREKGLAEILRRGRDDGSFPLTDPDLDAMAINAVVSRVLGGQTSDDPERLKQAQVATLDFAFRAVGALGRT